MRLSQTILLVALIFTARSFAGDLTIESGPRRANLLELYTSEGCSSCPPAESWFSQLKENPRLWKDLVPVAFHVDYWNGLGWPDPFSSKAFTARQRDLAASWSTASVYTPGFVLNGREWRRGEVPSPAESSGLLTVTLNAGRDLHLHYAAEGGAKDLEAHAATLGFDLESNVRTGENSGRKLRHDFVVLSLTAQPLNAKTSDAVIKLPRPANGEKAIAIWVTESGKLTPLQAAGAWLK